MRACLDLGERRVLSSRPAARRWPASTGTTCRPSCETRRCVVACLRRCCHRHGHEWACNNQMFRNPPLAGRMARRTPRISPARVARHRNARASAGVLLESRNGDACTCVHVRVSFKATVGRPRGAGRRRRRNPAATYSLSSPPLWLKPRTSPRGSERVRVVRVGPGSWPSN